MVINLPVTYERILILIFDMVERLISLFCDVHDGKPVKPNHCGRAEMYDRVVRPPALYGLIACHLFRSKFGAINNSPNAAHSLISFISINGIPSAI